MMKPRGNRWLNAKYNGHSLLGGTECYRAITASYPFPHGGGMLCVKQPWVAPSFPFNVFLKPTVALWQSLHLIDRLISSSWHSGRPSMGVLKRAAKWDACAHQSQHTHLQSCESQHSGPLKKRCGFIADSCFCKEKKLAPQKERYAMFAGSRVCRKQRV